MPQQTHKEEQEKEKLKQRIEELQSQNKYLREVIATQGQQQQQETFTAVGQLQLTKSNRLCRRRMSKDKLFYI